MSIEAFGNHVRTITIGSPEFHKLVESMKSEPTLKAYAGSLGYSLTDDQAGQIVAVNRAVAERAKEIGGATPLSDEALSAVVGGVNFTAIGALVGGGIAAVGAAIVLAPFAVAGAAACSVAVGIGATGFGGAAGTAIGAIVDALK